MKYKINKGFIAQKLGNRLTIFDGEKSQLVTFNETASFIFQRIKKGYDTDKIVELIVKKYGIAKITAQKDFDELVLQLKKLKILTRNN